MASDSQTPKVGQIVLDRFAKAIIAKDYITAHECFADWLKTQVSSEQLQGAIETQLREVADAAELTEIIYPEKFTIGYNSLELADLNLGDEEELELSGITPYCKLSPEITDENFRMWTAIVFAPTQEHGFEIGVDAWMDFAAAVVEVSGEERIGYFEIHMPD